MMGAKQEVERNKHFAFERIDCSREEYIMEKTLSEMNNRELFSVLSGSRGIMPQMMLRKVVMAYRKCRRGSNADLMTMVRAYVNGECRD